MGDRGDKFHEEDIAGPSLILGPLSQTYSLGYGNQPTPGKPRW